ncbi:MAG: radical SAM protein [Deltaproteobacteria bacterium]|nr:radical SAM protein [Deltaproteobacteria bacterium]
MRIYGPVPSRRFGLSLGVDLVPHKTCPYDCVYCQLGPTTCLTAQRRDFFAVGEVLRDVEEALEDGPRPDVITLAGSGEPTLYRSLPRLFAGIRDITDVPILLITNGALLFDEDLAEAVRGADILAPSLDAGDEETFARVNRPHADVPFERMVEGLARAVDGHPGQVRLEVMLVRDLNDSQESVEAIARRVAGMRADAIELNTPVRPPVPERGALPCTAETLERALRVFGPKTRAIGRFEARKADKTAPRPFDDVDKTVRETLVRRPCTLEDLVSSLGLAPAEARCSVDRLLSAGLVEARAGASGTYFCVPHPNPTL